MKRTLIKHELAPRKQSVRKMDVGSKAEWKIAITGSMTQFGTPPSIGSLFMFSPIWSHTSPCAARFGNSNSSRQGEQIV